jgi:hypothetical protein
MDLEAQYRHELEALLKSEFDVFQEATVWHPVLKTALRVDVLAVAKGQLGPKLAFAFEIKLDRRWDVPGLSAAIGQAASYVFCTFERSDGDKSTIVNSFLYPAPEWAFQKHHPICEHGQPADIFLAGMSHAAGASRIGFARKLNTLQISLSGEIIRDAVGWRANYKDLKDLSKLTQQCGSKRLPILSFIPTH